MRRPAHKIFDYFIFSHIFVALCAVSQAALTYLFIGVDPNPILLIIIFLATIFVYNFRVILYFKKIKAARKISINHRVAFVSRNAELIRVLTFFAAGAIIPFALLLNRITLLCGFATGTIALAYSTPFLVKLKGGLRQIPGLKTFIIAGVWALGTVLLPILQSEVVLEPHQLAILLAKRFIFIFVLALLFDLRDIPSDRKHGLKTIATSLGPFQTKILCIALMVIQLLLVSFYDYRLDQRIYIGLLASGLITAFFVIKASIHRDDYFCLFWVDGLMILQYVLVLLSVNFLQI